MINIDNILLIAASIVSIVLVLVYFRDVKSILLMERKKAGKPDVYKTVMAPDGSTARIKTSSAPLSRDEILDRVKYTSSPIVTKEMLEMLKK